MSNVVRKRPKRLWVAAIMNILIGLLSLGVLAFLVASARVPDALRPSGAAAILGVGTPVFLIVASVIALLGKSYGRYLMLSSAVLFYGTLIIQNALLFGGANDALGQGAAAKVAANVVRASIELLINLWALLSLKTRKYFGGAAVAP